MIICIASLAWIVLELYSLDSYCLLNSDDNMYRSSSLLAHMKEIRGQDWLIIVHHVSRIGNRVVKFFAKRILSRDIATDLLVLSPVGIHDLLCVDLETD
ncbi:hypothetical protein GQ457_02G035840 [Hibiscus cannabinus]